MRGSFVHNHVERSKCPVRMGLGNRVGGERIGEGASKNINKAGAAEC